jgi:hypothetical protein
MLVVFSHMVPLKGESGTRIILTRLNVALTMMCRRGTLALHMAAALRSRCLCRTQARLHLTHAAGGRVQKVIGDTQVILKRGEWQLDSAFQPMQKCEAIANTPVTRHMGPGLCVD